MPRFTARRLLTPLLSYQLRRSLRRLGVSTPVDWQPVRAASEAPQDIAIYRDNGRIRLGLPFQPAELVFEQREMITTYLYLLSHCPPEVAGMTGACSDGHLPSAARFAPSSRNERVIALPDRYFILRDGFSAERRLADTNEVPWHERRSTLVWRGGVNGDGIHPQKAEDADNPRVIQRLRLCMRLRTVADVDARISAPMGPHMPLNLLEPLGIVGSPRAEPEWLGDKFAIDIDGWTNTWSNLILRMHFGCCVLKVASADGYRQWWYEDLSPWEHFVPVAADLSDLEERIDWLRTNDAEAQAIARRGQALVRRMTMASETARGAALITQYWNTV